MLLGTTQGCSLESEVTQFLWKSILKVPVKVDFIFLYFLIPRTAHFFPLSFPSWQNSSCIQDAGSVVRLLLPWVFFCPCLCSFIFFNRARPPQFSPVPRHWSTSMFPPRLNLPFYFYLPLKYRGISIDHLYFSSSFQWPIETFWVGHLLPPRQQKIIIPSQYKYEDFFGSSSLQP